MKSQRVRKQELLKSADGNVRVHNAFTDICRLYDIFCFKDYRKYTFRGRKTKPIFQRHD